MKIHTFIFAAITSGLATTAFADSNTPPHAKYDRFKQQTEIGANVELNSGFPRLEIWLVSTVKGAQLADLRIDFWNVGTEWKYLHCQSLDFLVDDKPLEVHPVFASEMSGRLTLETWKVPITRVQLEQLSKATKIEYKVCTDEGVLPNVFVQDARDFIPLLDRALTGNQDPSAPLQPPAEAKQ